MGLVCLSYAHADEKTTLYDFRFWTSPERTRIVIDVEKGVQYHVNTNADKIDLAINNAKLLNAFKKHVLSVIKILCTFCLRPHNPIKLKATR